MMWKGNMLWKCYNELTKQLKFTLVPHFFSLPFLSSCPFFTFFIFFIFLICFCILSFYIYKKKNDDNVNSMRKINGCVNNECIENKCFNLRFFQKDIEMMWKHKKSTFFCFFLHFFISIYFGKIFLKKRSKLSYEIIYETIKAIKGHSFP